MNRSVIYVRYGDGSKPKGTKVVLGFSSRMTRPAYTDREGMAIVEHASIGKATVYVSGSAKGTFQAPGSFAVTI
jgi:hypothetical protein